MDWSQIKTLIENFGVLQWLIVGAIAFLVGTSPQAKGAAKWALSKVPSFSKPADDTDTIPLVDQIESLEARREYLLKQINTIDSELARIDKMLGAKRD